MSQPLAFDSSDAGRLARLQALDELLPALSGVLDVRDVFVRVSEIAQKVLVHDMVALLIPAEDRESVFVHAAYDTTRQVIVFPTRVPIAEPHRRLLQGGWDYRIVDDIQQDPVEKAAPPGQYGLRSSLRIAVTWTAMWPVCSTSLRSRPRSTLPPTHWLANESRTMSRWRCRTSGWRSRRSARPKRANVPRFSSAALMC
jgi:hypothetical protein